MNITTDISSRATLRAYGHCANATTNSSRLLTLCLSNLLNSTRTVSLSGILPIHQSGTVTTRTDYVLTPGEPAGGWKTCCIGHNTGLLDETKTPIVNLNGKPLALVQSGDGSDAWQLPSMGGVAGAGESVSLPPMAIAFVVVHGAPSCS